MSDEVEPDDADEPEKATKYELKIIASGFVSQGTATTEGEKA